MSAATRMPARAPMDARIRQRRIEVRQAAARRRRRAVLSIVAVVAVAAAGVAITRSPLFAITAVRVVGVEGEQARVVKQTADIARGQNLLSADFDQALARTRTLPWVADATVTREPPSTVVIRVTARQPVAVLDGPHGAWTVDRTGVVIAAAAEQRLPHIDMTSDEVPVPGSAINDLAVVNALQLHRALPKDVRRAMLAVEAVGARTVRVHLALDRLADPEGFKAGATTWVRFGAAGDVGDQVAVLRALLAQLRSAKAGVPSEVDVRVPSNPVVVP